MACNQAIINTLVACKSYSAMSGGGMVQANVGQKLLKHNKIKSFLC
jgi:hypothetical protein